MINKKESKRIWKWKAAAFLPVACVLLMSFSNKLEKAEIKKTLDIKELTVKKKKVKHWTEADFMDASIDKKAYLEIPYTVSVLVDQDYGIIVEQDVLRNKKIIKSQTVYHTEKYDDDFFIDNLENYERVIKKTINFKNASYQLKKQFKQVVVNGKKEMVSNYKIVISRGEYVDDSEYQKAFDLVGRTIESVKNNFSKERFSREYRELVRDEKNTIDKLVPIKVFYLNDRYKKPLTRIEKSFKFDTSNYSKVISLRKNNLVFLYNEFHNLYLNGHITWQLSNNRTRYIWKYFDYSKSDNTTKKLFKEVIINGVKLMASTANIYVEHENTTLQKSGIECLNQLVGHISKIFLRIKEKNSKLVYSRSYADLSLNEKANIDSLLPNKIISCGKELHFAKGIRAVSKRNKVYLVEKLLPKDIKKDIDLNKSKINNMSIIINNDSMIYINRKLVALEDTLLEETFLKYRVYSKADANTKKYFKSVIINGKKVMISKSGLNIMYESSFENNAKDVIRRLDVLRLRVKNNFANDIFSRPYNELRVKEQHQISKLIPFYSIGNVNKLSLKAI
jgi:hypothetical protein